MSGILLSMEEIIAVKTFLTRTEAEIAKSFLKSHNIDSYILADDEGQNFLDRAMGSFGVQLMIHRKNLAKAKILFAEVKEVRPNL